MNLQPYCHGAVVCFSWQWHLSLRRRLQSVVLMSEFGWSPCQSQPGWWGRDVQACRTVYLYRHSLPQWNHCQYLLSVSALWFVFAHLAFSFMLIFKMPVFKCGIKRSVYLYICRYETFSQFVNTVYADKQLKSNVSSVRDYFFFLKVICK